MAPAPRRRLSGAFLVAIAAVTLVAIATVAGAGERPFARADGDVTTAVQSQHREPAVTPAKRQSTDHVPFVVVAVLVTLVGAVTTGASTRRPAERRQVLFAVLRRAVRLRGPPPVPFTL